MPDLPRGTVTLLFTDIEGSTRLLQELGERYCELPEEYHRRVREAVGTHGGVAYNLSNRAGRCAGPRGDLDLE